jgi:hypothetical protein
VLMCVAWKLESIAACDMSKPGEWIAGGCGEAIEGFRSSDPADEA